MAAKQPLKPIVRASGGYQVKWRRGTAKRPDWQSSSFTDEKHALHACDVVEAHRRKITDDEVYKIVLGLEVEAEEGPDTPYFAEWAMAWVEKKRAMVGKAKGVQPDTVKGYERTLINVVIPKLGKFRLHEIKYDEQVAEWMTWLEKDLGRKPGTIRRYHTVVYQCLKAAVGKYIPVNPLDPPPDDSTSHLPKMVKFDACFLTPKEAYLIIQRCSDYIRDLVEVAFHTGMRLGELIVLRATDVNLRGKKKVVYVRRALKNDGSIGTPKSEKSRRSITLNKIVVDIFTRLLDGKRPNDLIFTAPEGGMWNKNNFRNRFWTPAVLAAQRCAEHPPPPLVDKRGKVRDDPRAVSTCACEGRLHQTPRFHDCRHTHVAWLIDAGWNAYSIQRRIGHESIKTTFDVYGHLLPDADEAGLEALDKFGADGRSSAVLALAA